MIALSGALRQLSESENFPASTQLYKFMWQKFASLKKKTSLHFVSRDDNDNTGMEMLILVSDMF